MVFFSPYAWCELFPNNRHVRVVIEVYSGVCVELKGTALATDKPLIACALPGVPVFTDLTVFALVCRLRIQKKNQSLNRLVPRCGRRCRREPS